LGEDTQEQERRRHRRLATDILVEIAYTEPEGEDRLVAFKSINISASGLLLEANLALPRGTLLIARFMLPERERPISFLTEVIRLKTIDKEESLYRIGMNFTNVTSEGLKDLDEILKHTFGEDG